MAGIETLRQVYVRDIFGEKRLVDMNETLRRDILFSCGDICEESLLNTDNVYAVKGSKAYRCVSIKACKYAMKHNLGEYVFKALSGGYKVPTSVFSGKVYEQWIKHGASIDKKKHIMCDSIQSLSGREIKVVNENYSFHYVASRVYDDFGLKIPVNLLHTGTPDKSVLYDYRNGKIVSYRLHINDYTALLKIGVSSDEIVDIYNDRPDEFGIVTLGDVAEIMRMASGLIGVPIKPTRKITDNGFRLLMQCIDNIKFIRYLESLYDYGKEEIG